MSGRFHSHSGDLRSDYVSHPSSEYFSDYMKDYRDFRPDYVSCDLPVDLGHWVECGCRHRLLSRRQQTPAQPLLSLFVSVARMPVSARPAVSLSLTPPLAAGAAASPPERPAGTISGTNGTVAFDAFDLPRGDRRALAPIPRLSARPRLLGVGHFSRAHPGQFS